MKSINFRNIKSFLTNTKNQIFLFNKNKYNFRLGDIVIITGVFSVTSLYVIFLKNFYFDMLRSTPKEYNLYMWTRLKGYYRIEREPFVYKPEESEYRDLEKYNKYMDEKKPERIFDFSSASEDNSWMYIPKQARERVSIY